MQIGVLGIDHKIAPLSVREAFTRAVSDLFFPSSPIAKQYSCVVLLTCNRAEIYFSAHDLQKAHQEISGQLQQRLSFSLKDVCYSFLRREGFVHLARVTSGLESAILAETDIQRQVKNAYSSASAHYPLRAPLHYLFQKSLKIAKSIRSGCPFWTRATSLEAILYDLGKSTLEDIEKANILFLGNSKTNRKILPYFKRKGCQHLFLWTRRPQQAKDLQEKWGVTVAMQQIVSCALEADVIISATISDQYLLKKEHFQKERSQIMMCDLSVPRVIDPKLSQLDHIELFNMEEISSFVKQKRSSKDKEILCSSRDIELAVERQIKIFNNKQRRQLLKKDSVCA